MQLMPGTAGMYGVTNAFDPKQNIAAGAKHLKMLLDLFDGDFELAAAGYNAGENAVLRFGGIPPYAETQVYVERVGILERRYASELAKQAANTGKAAAMAAGGM
jgi:soluble lytic murein transglycosylase-like protein